MPGSSTAKAVSIAYWCRRLRQEARRPGGQAIGEVEEDSNGEQPAIQTEDSVDTFSEIDARRKYKLPALEVL